MALGGPSPNTLLVDVVVIAVATGLVRFGHGWLESSAESPSSYHGLPAVIPGSVVVAAGSRIPELAGVPFTALAGVFNMGVGAIVGSTVFKILVTPATASIPTADPIGSSRTIVHRKVRSCSRRLSNVNTTSPGGGR